MLKKAVKKRSTFKLKSKGTDGPMEARKLCERMHNGNNYQDKKEFLKKAYFSLTYEYFCDSKLHGEAVTS